jgi:flagellar protein FliS
MKPMTSAERYREQEFLTAPPGRLLVLTFDALLTALTRTRIGVASGNDELAQKGVQQARDLLTELLATLDHEKGGEIAKNLGSLYLFALERLHGIPKKGDMVRYDQIVQLLTPIRDAFNEIASIPAAQRAAVA